MEICGELPKKRRTTDSLTTVGLSVLAVSLGWIVLRGLNVSQFIGAGLQFIVAGACGGLILAGVLMTAWEWWRTVTEFNFDGSSLKLRTYGKPELQTFDRSRVARVEDWTNNGKLVGYRLKLRDGAQFFLSLKLSNVRELAAAFGLSE